MKNKQEKIIVLNSIHNLTEEITTELIPVVNMWRKLGLRKGKIAHIEYIVLRLRELADALEIYNSKEFTLDNMQDYQE